MKEKITTEIDSELKTIFEATRRLHRLSYRDILEKGIREVIADVDPQKLIEYELQKTDSEQEERRQTLTALKMRPAQKKIVGFVDPELEKRREKLFSKDYESILRLGSGVNWDYIVTEYRFKDRKEAREWISSHIEVSKTT